MSKQFRVYNPLGADLGVYSADTAQAAIEACVRDAGYDSIDDMENRLAEQCDLEAVEAGRFVVEGLESSGRWSREAVEAGGDAGFDTESDATAAIDALVAACGWSRADLRVREA
jgi:hypothetical protein